MTSAPGGRDEGPAVVLLAAGLSRRFGSLKQLQPFGPEGEALMDYTVWDALRAGFCRVVVVTRPELDDRVRAHAAERWPGVRVSLVHQDPPLGTAHAVLSAEGAVPERFAVANADDLYGPSAWGALATSLECASGNASHPATSPGRAPAPPFPSDRATPAGAADPAPPVGAVVGYRLEDTLSPRGGVSRALCRTDEAGLLRRITELRDVRRGGEDGLAGVDPDDGVVSLRPDDTVSMNLWGFPDALFPLLRGRFDVFRRGSAHGKGEELALSTAVDDLVQQRALRMRVLEAERPDARRPPGASGPPPGWTGVTFPGDREEVVERLVRWTENGWYPRGVAGALRHGIGSRTDAC